MGKSRKKSKKTFQPFGGWEKPLKYAVYRTMMDSAGKDPWKRSGVALGAGKTGVGAYYLTKGIQQMNAELKGKSLPKSSDHIDPYAAAGAAMGMGFINDTEDLVDLAFELDAVGAFDPPEWESDRGCPRPVRRNQYAWRLCCDDGRAYGISPYDYETREEYNAALFRAKGGATAASKDAPRPASASGSGSQASRTDSPTFVFCRVSRLDNGHTEYFLSDTEDIRVGSTVSIPGKDGLPSVGVVLGVEKHTGDTAPQDPNDTQPLL